jgi:8-oxo-dGTP pyrophosphatase MutT (NUDIX family)
MPFATVEIHQAYLQEVVFRFEPGDGEAQKSLELMRSLAAFSANPFTRSEYYPGHFTCTGLVLHPDRSSVLLVHHARLERWLLPGGHIEDEDPSLPHAAAREVVEETGVRVDAGEARLVNVDVHPIPPKKGEPLHLHHDLIFAFPARSTETACSEESRAVTWCGLDEADRYELPLPIRRALQIAVRG